MPAHPQPVPIALVLMAGVLLAPAPAQAARAGCVTARKACVAAARSHSRGCERDCGRLPARPDVVDCRTTCRTARADAEASCRAVADPCRIACGADRAACEEDRRTCRRAARRGYGACRATCEGGRDLRCVIACDRQRASAEAGCGFVAVRSERGPADVPALPAGRPADLSVLLDAAELAVVAAADARAAALRTRDLRLRVGRPGTRVTVTQTRHGFTFGFPLDFRRFRDTPDELAFYGDIARDHTNLLVAEASLKWRNAEPEAGRFDFTLADAELAWAAARGFPVKGHTLLWGNAPPLSTGSGIPVWLRERFPNPSLTAAKRAELRGLVRRQVETIVGRYRGRIAVWDVTNETMNVFTQWFIDRLGPEIVPELFAWVQAIDPGAQLVFNEWITEVFTGLPGPSAAQVRDRVRALRAAGAPIHAIGQQGHFVPGIAYAGFPADFTRRTRIDDYAAALDTLAEVGLPVHITEFNVVAPEVPEERAAQAEALMRLWWGHPAVEEVVFWGLWNRVVARAQFQHGLWTDAGELSRHGEAVVSLLNDRWRTRAILDADADGVVALRATLGEYVAAWQEDGEPVHVRFRLERGAGPATVVVLGE